MAKRRMGKKLVRGESGKGKEKVVKNAVVSNYQLLTVRASKLGP